MDPQARIEIVRVPAGEPFALSWDDVVLSVEREGRPPRDVQRDVVTILRRSV